MDENKKEPKKITIDLWKLVLIVILLLVLAPVAPVIWALIAGFMALLVAVPWLILPMVFAGIGVFFVGYLVVKLVLELLREK